MQSTRTERLEIAERLAELAQIAPSKVALFNEFAEKEKWSLQKQIGMLSAMAEEASTQKRYDPPTDSKMPICQQAGFNAYCRENRLTQDQRWAILAAYHQEGKLAFAGQHERRFANADGKTKLKTVSAAVFRMAD